jgi:hypothetical protein
MDEVKVLKYISPGELGGEYVPIGLLPSGNDGFSLPAPSGGVLRYPTNGENSYSF